MKRPNQRAVGLDELTAQERRELADLLEDALLSLTVRERRGGKFVPVEIEDI